MSTDSPNHLNSKTLIVICGPTASGKTQLSIELSKLLNIEVISADSRQIFKYLDIGTAKPTPDELNEVPTHFIDIINPDEYYSSGIFESEAEHTVNQIVIRNKFPVVVGGSGLYIQALCEGFFHEKPDKDQILTLRDELDNTLKIKGIGYLADKLFEVDKDSYDKYSDKNPRRILRALEFYYSSGVPFSEAQKQKQSEKIFKPYYFGIDFEREELYKRINLRSELMWHSGLLQETEKVLAMGFSPELNSLNTVGYKEAISYLNGSLSSDEALEKMKQNTRRYAKRQMTWFRKNSNIVWLGGSSQEMAVKIYKFIKNIEK